MSKTDREYDEVVAKCKDIFTKKMRDYGSAWRILRLPSLTDQIFIKAQRIQTLEQKGESKVGEGIWDEYLGIVNYCIMAQIQIDLNGDSEIEMSVEEASRRYDEKVQLTKELMQRKNHDYGEAWRDMRLGSLTDLILMKLYRIKQIEDNQGYTEISEGIDANYQDIMNYSIFALIKLS
jgi:hypothetical protein